MNYSDEIHRFGRAGELWAQADPAKLSRVDRHDGRAAASAGARPSPSTRRAATSCARRTCPGSRTTCTRRWRRSSGHRSTTTARISSAGPARRRRAGSSSSGSGWTPFASSAARADWSRPATMPGTSIRSTASASRASWSCTRKPDFTRWRSSSTPPGTARGCSGWTTGWARCARDSSPICWSSTAIRSTT